MKKVLILNAPYGNGHKQSSSALKNKFLQNDICTVELDYYNEFCNKFITSFSKWVHSKSFTSIGRILYKYGYIISSNMYYPELSSKHAVGIKKLSKYIINEKITDVICTFPISSTYYLSKKHNNINFHYVVTDFSLHKKWINKYAKNIFIGDSRIIENNPEISNLVLSGIPIIKKEIDIEKIKKYKKSNTVISIIYGANGVINNNDEMISKISSKYFVNIICGKNNELRNKLEKKYEGNKNIAIYGFIDDVHNLYKASDLVITKSGGITCSELIFYQTKVILFKPQYGQETDNAKFLRRYNAASIINYNNLLSEIEKKLKCDVKWEKFRIENSEEIIVKEVINNEN